MSAKKIKFDFTNKQQQTLSGLLELPTQLPASCYAVFAHCFTCGKDVAAASRISRALAAQGIAVLRFDFTGLGNSDGDFANTNFSSNIDDLLAAIDALSDAYAAPSLLIGHSLGGAAVLAAAGQVASVKAVATIAAPATADHVEHLFAAHSEEIVNQGEAQVGIGLRQFTIKKQLLDDIQMHNSTQNIANLRKALIVFHSPLDKIVSIDQASMIYTAAKHPKSFVSLDKADHLLSNKDDANYVAVTLAAWVSRYMCERSLDEPQQSSTQPALAAGEVAVSELNHNFLRGLSTADHQLMADEPLSFGGSNQGPTPYDLLLMGLGACTSMTIRMYAKRKKIPLTDVHIVLRHESIHAKDCDDCEATTGKVERISRDIKFEGELSNAQREDLMRIADRCPVHKTLKSDVQIINQLLASSS